MVMAPGKETMDQREVAGPLSQRAGDREGVQVSSAGKPVAGREGYYQRQPDGSVKRVYSRPPEGSGPRVLDMPEPVDHLERQLAADRQALARRAEAQERRREGEAQWRRQNPEAVRQSNAAQWRGQSVRARQKAMAAEGAMDPVSGFEYRYFTEGTGTMERGRTYVGLGEGGFRGTAPTERGVYSVHQTGDGTMEARKISGSITAHMREHPDKPVIHVVDQVVPRWHRDNPLAIGGRDEADRQRVDAERRQIAAMERRRAEITAERENRERAAALAADRTEREAAPGRPARPGGSDVGSRRDRFYAERKPAVDKWHAGIGGLPAEHTNSFFRNVTLGASKIDELRSAPKPTRPGTYKYADGKFTRIGEPIMSEYGAKLDIREHQNILHVSDTRRNEDYVYKWEAGRDLNNPAVTGRTPPSLAGALPDRPGTYMWDSQGNYFEASGLAGNPERRGARLVIQDNTYEARMERERRVELMRRAARQPSETKADYLAREGSAGTRGSTDRQRSPIAPSWNAEGKTRGISARNPPGVVRPRMVQTPDGWKLRYADGTLRDAPKAGPAQQHAVNAKVTRLDAATIGRSEFAQASLSQPVRRILHRETPGGLYGAPLETGLARAGATTASGKTIGTPRVRRQPAWPRRPSTPWGRPLYPTTRPGTPLIERPAPPSDPKAPRKPIGTPRRPTPTRPPGYKPSYPIWRPKPTPRRPTPGTKPTSPRRPLAPQRPAPAPRPRPPIGQPRNPLAPQRPAPAPRPRPPIGQPRNPLAPQRPAPAPRPRPPIGRPRQPTRPYRPSRYKNPRTSAGGLSLGSARGRVSVGRRRRGLSI